ncbi:uncharacterized protein LTR77_002492 [Saxophila tyrrhenica]|uniref:AB hydrolase-1 domain-containing protein n=1 Tax=Saxophila tyrrhenica TaxID=1690608 RepID=A0AAV9PKN0_9PEZI|nr:hypothetical protein LTR77_002492 [Saxophila tyrrhenica]
MASTPTFILVPGHWHTPTHLRPLTTALSDRGLPYKTQQLHTVGRKPPGPRPCYSDDVSVIYTAVTTELLAGRDVCLVLHSYAGVPGAEAVNCLLKDGVVETPDFRRWDFGYAPPEGIPYKPLGSLVKVVFIAAYTIPAGVNIDPKDFVGPSNPGFSIDSHNMTHMASPWHFFFSDLPLSAAKPYVDACAETYYVGPMHLTSERWKKARVSTLICAKDNAIPRSKQEGMWEWLVKREEERDDARMAEEEEDEWGKMVEWIDACHAPWVKKADDVAAFLARGIANAKGKAKVDGGVERSGWA